jgi:hypothetical protein
VSLSPKIGLADLVRACRALRPEDAATAREIAALLGFEGGGPSARPARRAPRPVARSRPVPPPVRDAAAPDAPGVSEARAEETPSPIRLESLGVDDSADEAGSIERGTGEDLPTPEQDDRPDRPPIEPLLGPLRSRAILSAALGSEIEDGPVDVPRLVDRVARDRAVERIPRLAVRSLRRGAQVLIDRGPGMLPFHRDLQALVEELPDVAGRAGLRLLQYAVVPCRGAGAGWRGTWKRYRPPGPGTPVLLVSDLGASGATEEPPASRREWRTFLDALRAAGCPALALTPYPWTRTSPFVRDRLRIVEWDRTTSAAQVVRLAEDASRGPA